MSNLIKYKGANTSEMIVAGNTSVSEYQNLNVFTFSSPVTSSETIPQNYIIGYKLNNNPLTNSYFMIAPEQTVTSWQSPNIQGTYLITIPQWANHFKFNICTLNGSDGANAGVIKVPGVSIPGTPAVNIGGITIIPAIPGYTIFSPFYVPPEITVCTQLPPYSYFDPTNGKYETVNYPEQCVNTGYKGGKGGSGISQMLTTPYLFDTQDKDNGNITVKIDSNSTSIQVAVAGWTANSGTNGNDAHPASVRTDIYAPPYSVDPDDYYTVGGDGNDGANGNLYYSGNANSYPLSNTNSQNIGNLTSRGYGAMIYFFTT
jgi:hypothetical protein